MAGGDHQPVDGGGAHDRPVVGRPGPEARGRRRPGVLVEGGHHPPGVLDEVGHARRGGRRGRSPAPRRWPRARGRRRPGGPGSRTARGPGPAPSGAGAGTPSGARRRTVTPRTGRTGGHQPSGRPADVARAAAGGEHDHVGPPADRRPPARPRRPGRPTGDPGDPVGDQGDAGGPAGGLQRRGHGPVVDLVVAGQVDPAADARAPGGARPRRQARAPRRTAGSPRSRWKASTRSVAARSDGSAGHHQGPVVPVVDGEAGGGLEVPGEGGPGPGGGQVEAGQVLLAEGRLGDRGQHAGGGPGGPAAGFGIDDGHRRAPMPRPTRPRTVRSPRRRRRPRRGGRRGSRAPHRGPGLVMGSCYGPVPGSVHRRWTRDPVGGLGARARRPLR